MHFPYILHCNGNVFSALTNDPDKLSEKLFFNNLPFDLFKGSELVFNEVFARERVSKAIVQGCPSSWKCKNKNSGL